MASRGQSAPAEEVLGAGGKLRKSTARRQATRSRTVADVAGLADAVWSGDVGVDHIDTFAQRLKHLTADERSRVDTGRLVDKAKTMPADRFDRAVKNEVDRVREDHGLKDAIQKRQASEFHHWFDHKIGMGRFYGTLDPERYESLTSAIDQHVNSLAASNGSTTQTGKDTGAARDKISVTKTPAVSAAALCELVCTSPSRSQNLPHITVVVDHKTLREGGGHKDTTCQTGNGHDVPPETVERFGCNAVLQKVVLDDRGIPINVGRKYRTATDAQWVATRAVYSGCAWPECEQPLSWCQLHHIKEWGHGGDTDLDNLVPLCNTHHHRVHEGKWSLQLNQNRSLQIWRPDKQLHTKGKPPSRAASTDDRPSGIDTAPP